MHINVGRRGLKIWYTRIPFCDNAKLQNDRDIWQAI